MLDAGQEHLVVGQLSNLLYLSSVLLPRRLERPPSLLRRRLPLSRSRGGLRRRLFELNLRMGELHSCLKPAFVERIN